MRPEGVWVAPELLGAAVLAARRCLAQFERFSMVLKPLARAQARRSRAQTAMLTY